MEHRVNGDIVGAYLSSIGDTPVLRAEEEVDLAMSIEAGLIAREALRYRADSYADDKAANKERQQMYFELRDSQISTMATISKAKLAVQTRQAEIFAVKTLGFIRRKADEPRDDLTALVAEGDRAFKTMVTHNLKLVASLSYEPRNSRIDHIDLISWGNLGLIHAIKKFDYRAGNKFSSYATNWIKKYFATAYAAEGYEFRLPTDVEDDIQRLQKARNRLAANQLEPDPEALAALTGFKAAYVRMLMERDQSAFRLDQSIESTTDGKVMRESLGSLVLSRIEPAAEPLPDPRTDEKLWHLLLKLPYDLQIILVHSYGLFGNKRMTESEVRNYMARFGWLPPTATAESIRRKISLGLQLMRESGIDEVPTRPDEFAESSR